MHTPHFLSFLLSILKPEDPNIGRTWNSPEGLATVAYFENGKYMANYSNNKNTYYHISPESLERTILIDEDRHIGAIAREKRDREHKIEEQKKKEDRYDDAGFTSSLSGIRKERIIETLNKLVRWSGVVGTRKDQIAKIVENGGRVSTLNKHGNVIKVLYTGKKLAGSSNPLSEWFLEEKDVTKTSIDFAEYLINIRDSRVS